MGFQQNAYAKRSFTYPGSTLMPGPMVVEIAMLFKYVPLLAGGFNL
jgi:hypothetical protein